MYANVVLFNFHAYQTGIQIITIYGSFEPHTNNNNI